MSNVHKGLSLSTGTSGSDLNITTTPGVAVINLPDAGSAARGAVTTGAQTIAGDKTFSGAILASSGSVSAPSVAFSADADGSGTGLYRATTNSPAIAANGVQVLLIDADGRHTIGNSSTTVATHLIQNNSTSNASVTIRNNDSTSSSDTVYNLICQKGSTSGGVGANRFIIFKINSGSTNSGYIGSNGTDAANFFSTSDRRLKTDIADLSGALDKVMALRPVEYRWKSDGTTGRGFIAQELKQVLPQLVVPTDDGAGETVPEGQEPWSMTESGFVPYLVKALQELKAEFDAYKAAHP